MAGCLLTVYIGLEVLVASSEVGGGHILSLQEMLSGETPGDIYISHVKSRHILNTG